MPSRNGTIPDGRDSSSDYGLANRLDWGTTMMVLACDTEGADVAGAPSICKRYSKRGRWYYIQREQRYLCQTFAPVIRTIIALASVDGDHIRWM